jgi:HSP20 family protein
LRLFLDDNHVISQEEFVVVSIVRWNPVREMAAMQNAIDRMFEESWRSVRPTVAGNALPLDVYETDSAYTVYTALPGVTPDQISVSLHDDVLTISGEVAQPVISEDANARVLLYERSYGKFTRSIRLTQPIDQEHIEAAYENGVLTLTLPKAPEAQPKLIPVKTNGHAASQN